MRVVLKRDIARRLADLRFDLEKAGSLHRVKHVELEKGEWEELYECFTIPFEEGGIEDEEGNIIIYGLKLVKKL